MDWTDPDDPETAMGVVERQDRDPNPRWQAARRRVLVRADLKCEHCGAEHNRQIVTHLYRPGWWVPFTAGMARPDVSSVVTVTVVVVPLALPWSGEDVDLAALCMGCYFRHAVAVACAREPMAKPPQRALF